MLQLVWLKKLANCYGRPFARLGIRQKIRNLANPYQFHVIRIGKSWRIPKDLANSSFLANPYLANPSFSMIKNRALANPSSGELLRALAYTCILALEIRKSFDDYACDIGKYFLSSKSEFKIRML